MQHGDTDACYRKNWEWSPLKSCKANKSKFMNMICMDDCRHKAGMEVC